MLIAYRRAANIVAIEERRTAGPTMASPQRFAAAEEKHLADRLSEVGAMSERWLQSEDFESDDGIGAIAGPVDAFFDKVTVNTDEPELRENRLRLLARIRDTMNRVADFSQIEG